MAKQVGEMEFWLRDYHETDAFNESVDCTYELWVENEIDEILSIEKYHDLCKRFAAAMGFAERTINEWFGEY